MFLSNKIVYGYAIALGITSLGTATGLLLGNYHHQEVLQKSQVISQERKSINTLQLDILYNRPTQQLSPQLKNVEVFRQESRKLLESIQIISNIVKAHHNSGEFSTIEGLEALLKEQKQFLTEFQQEYQDLFDRLERLTISPNTSPKNLIDAELQLVAFFKSKNFLRFIEFSDRLSPFAEIVYQREKEVDLDLSQAKVVRIQIVLISMFLSVVTAALFIKCASHAIAIEQAQNNQRLQDQLVERQQTEAKLLKSEAHQRAILSAIPDMIIRMNREGFYSEFVTKPNFSVVGILNELVGTHVSETLPADIATRRVNHIQQVFQTNSMQIYEQNIFVDGREQIEEVRIVPYNENEVLLLVRDVSEQHIAMRERKQAELALAASEAKSRAMLAAIPDLMFRVGADGFYREFVTQSRDFAIATAKLDRAGMSMAEVLPADIIEQQFYYLQKAIETGELQVYEQQIQVGDRLICEEVRAVKSGEDEVLFMIRDISDRKQAEAKLEKEYYRSAMLFNTSLDGLFVLDLQGYLIDANQSFANMLGYSREEVMSLSIYDIDAKWSAVELLSGIQEFAQEKSVKFETLHRRKDGSLLTVEISASSVDWSGEIVQFGICRDITERKQAEQQLQELNQFLEAKVKERTSELQKREVELQKLSERLALSLKSGAIGTWEWDIRQNTLRWDDRMYELFGITGQPELRRNSETNQNIAYDIWSNGLHPDDRTETETLLHQAILGNAEYDTEFRVVHPDRSIHFIKAYGIVVRDDQGQPYSMLGVNFDISDRKQSELQLQRTNEELVRATRLKDEFLANMSHELRTPLNAILGMTEGLQDQVFGEINQRQLKALRTVERSASHLLELINDILDLAKIEAGHIKLEPTPTAINHLCQSSMTFVKQQASQKNIQLDIKLQSNLPPLLIDERRIRQVLINLLNNAVKFTPKGGRVTLESKQLTPNIATSDRPLQQYLQISITDTGIGISPENIQKLFQPFIQIDSALNRQYEGTGLGLALVKRIVELHGGKVGLTSEVNAGSCFTVELPYDVTSEVVLSNNPETTLLLNTPITKATKDQSPLILLVEDNEANIITISSYLEANGYQILLANNGKDAITLAKVHQPDLILMDIQMPVMDGIESTQKIRLDPKFVDTPIIAMTALAMSGDCDRCLAAGANKYLSKPMKLRQLEMTIQELLNARDGTNATSSS
ncbi:PAS domain S-box protein [Pseudanabaena galeata UHCC 0370]|uniref:histidine kinase n=1 Tax=Pseudanabaena galeata UHCC 0370 TaxID=3110310 RepID=A0ABU5TRP8_9CYAN|nr:PAS domain S-box protein [Pseudanabaena galeata]MEA5480726.1 PAS domain S-box protein [Pseudanabaena galeata UHCC 0370]